VRAPHSFCSHSRTNIHESEFLAIFFGKSFLSLIHIKSDSLYVSGAGTDSSEKGRMMWARVKGKTENDLIKLKFKNVFAFRPAFMKAIKGQKNLPKFYKFIQLPYPVLHALFPKYFGTLNDVGLAMINCALTGSEKKVLEARDIAEMARTTVYRQS